MAITDRYDYKQLNQILAFYSAKKTTDFIFPDQLKKTMPGVDVDKIEQMLKDIALYNDSIIKDVGENNMYHHQFKKGPFLDEFLKSGGFKIVSEHVVEARKREGELQKLQIESLEAAPEAVRVAAEANRLAHEANAIARENKKSTKWNTRFAGLALLISIIALLKTFNII
jgi:hypothetical protein